MLNKDYQCDNVIWDKPFKPGSKPKCRLTGLRLTGGNVCDPNRRNECNEHLSSKVTGSASSSPQKDSQSNRDVLFYGERNESRATSDPDTESGP